MNSYERWDPVALYVPSKEKESQYLEIEKALDFYKKHPYRIALLSFLLCIVIPIALFAVFFLQNKDLFTLGIEEASAYLVSSANVNLLYFAVFSFFIGSVYSVIETSTAKYNHEFYANFNVARSNEWIFSEPCDIAKADTLSKVFPEIFLQGDERSIDSQWWGATNSRKGSINFWVGDYHVAWKDGKSSVSADYTIFAFHLKKESHADFFVKAETFNTKVKNFFTRTDIDLESIEFNRLFNISYAGIKSEIDKKIFQALNPALMSALLDFRQSHGPFNLFFKGDTLLVTFNKLEFHPASGFLFFPGHDNIRYKEKVENRIKKVLEHCGEIVDRLD